MGWKDYFYFSKTERNGITILIIIILIILVYPWLHNRLNHTIVYDYDVFRKELDEYNILMAEYIRAKEAIHTERQRISRPAGITLTPFPFNPNELTKEEFMELGLPERIAGHIINFRNAGGSFRYKEDLSRIYSIDDDLYAELAPYIQLPDRPERVLRERETESYNQRNRARSDTTPRGPRQAISYRQAIMVDINQADSLQWQQIRGIGPVFSKRIIAYRERLGGFYSTEQIREVFGMDSVRFESIISHISINPDSLYLRRININEADFATLVRHPYLNRNQVNSILRMRERHGLYQNTEDIKRSELINEDDFRRLAPYLTIEEPSHDFSP